MNDQKPEVTDELLTDFVKPDPNWEERHKREQEMWLRQYCVTHAIQLENANVGVQDHVAQIERVLSNAEKIRFWIVEQPLPVNPPIND